MTQPEPVSGAERGEGRSQTGTRVVLLAGPDESTNIVANYLESRFGDLVVVMESAPSRVQMALRRARRLGWLEATGQVLFITLVQPLLHYTSKQRRENIRSSSFVNSNPRVPDHSVSSVNDEQTVSLLRSLEPSAVVVHGTRMITPPLLKSLDCPILNIHAGLTPRFRGVHGGYWALVEGHPEWVGTTVHLVDPGIDTGGILAQTTFTISNEDSIATYPDLHLLHGLPLLAAQIDNVLAGRSLEPVAESLVPGSCLRYHPTLWGYFRRRWSSGVR